MDGDARVISGRLFDKPKSNPPASSGVSGERQNRPHADGTTAHPDQPYVRHASIGRVDWMSSDQAYISCPRA